MDDSTRLSWIMAFILLLCAMYFAVTEIAFSSVSRNRIKVASDRGDSRAKKALYILDNFDRAISTLLICTNIVHISTASIVTVAVTRIWGLSAVSVSTIITTIAVFFAGEMLPKSIAKKYSETFAKACAGPLLFLMKVFAPLAAALAAFSRAVANLTKSEAEISVTEEELYDIIEDMTEEGSLDEQQSELISSALQFGDVTVESIITPRVDVIAIDVKSACEEILETVKAQSHSRLPVYEGSIDNVIGILQIRKFIKAYLHKDQGMDIRPLLDKALFIHQSTNIDELLPIMSKNRQNMAIVTDNYGGTLGIVTVEDILEELVGEIWDEDDVVEEPVVARGDGSFTVNAEESVSDVLQQIGFDDPEGNDELVNTLMSEWAYSRFTSIPRKGDSFLYHGLRVTVSEMEHNRILKLDLKVTGEEGGAEK